MPEVGRGAGRLLVAVYAGAEAFLRVVQVDGTQLVETHDAVEAIYHALVLSVSGEVDSGGE